MGLGIVSWCQERAGARTASVSRTPFPIWRPNMSPCLDACCGLEPGLGREIYCPASVANYFKCHLGSGVFLNLWMASLVQRTTVRLPVASS